MLTFQMLTFWPSNNSIALYQRVTTIGVKGISGEPNSLARPKSAVLKPILFFVYLR